MPAKLTKEQKQAKDEAEVLAKIATWPEPRRAIGERLHELISATYPELKPRLWYGMPGYAKDGPVLVYFRTDQYMTFGLTEKARFEGVAERLVPTAWFFETLDEATERKIIEIIKQGVS